MNKEQFLSPLGPFPKKTPLDIKVIETQNFDNYRQDKVIFPCETNDSISAYLLTPHKKKKKTKTPAIFCHHQHAGNFELGKSEVVGLSGDPDQAYAKELAELGYIVLAPDALGFEERNWSTGANACYYEMATRIIKGQTMLAKNLHDISVAIDYLTSLKSVDTDNIGFIGHSYGGRMALWAPAYDNRIKASVSHCGCINYKDSIKRDRGIQMEFCVPNILNHYDIEDLVSLIAPGGHVFTKEMRTYAYDFLNKHLV